MDIKKNFKEILRFGLKNDASRKKMIASCAAIVPILNSKIDKKLSERMLKQIVGGTPIWGRLPLKDQDDYVTLEKKIWTGKKLTTQEQRRWNELNALL